MPYQEMLSRAWAIFKKQRALWLFGFLTACSGGTYGRLNLPSFNFNTFNFQSLESGPPDHISPEVEYFFRQLTQIPDQAWLFIALGSIFLIMVWIVFMMVLRSFAEPALIRGILATIENPRPLSVGEIAAQGRPFFGRMLLFHLVVGGSALIAVLLFVMGLGTFIVGTMGIGLLCLLPLFLLLIPAAWLLELYLMLTTLALIIEDLTILGALERGWQILKNNFWTATLTGMLLTVIRMAISIPLGILLAVFLVPTIAFIIFLGSTANSIIPFLVLGALVMGFIILVSAGLMGLLQTYLESAWVLAYRHFIGQPLGPDAPALPAQEDTPEEEKEQPPQAQEPPLSAPETP